MWKTCARLIVGKPGLATDQTAIRSSKLALGHARVRGDRHPGRVVPGFDRDERSKWCPEEDSNLHDLAIAST